MSLQYAPAPVPDELRRRYRLDGHQSDLLITSLLRRNASEFGRLPAILDGAIELTWAELVTSATRFGGFLWSQGLRPGDAVTWQVPNWWEALVVAHGIWSIGCVSNPIVEISRELEIGRVLDAVRPKAIVTAREFRGCDHTALWSDVSADTGAEPMVRVSVRGAATGWTPIDQALRASPMLVDDVDADAPALVLMTSGTTSGAKGVVHSTRSYLSYPLRTCRWYSLGWADRSFSPFTMGHVGGLTFAVGVPLFTGGSAVVVDRWDAAVAVDSIRTRGVTYSGGTALFAREMLDVVARDEHPTLPLAKGYLCGATPFSAALAEAVEGLGLQATRAYGMTEVPTVSGSAIFDAPDVRLHTDGYVAPGCEIRVLDDGKDVGPGAVGEFVVRGPHQALGYLDLAHTRDGFDDEGWFRTGDLGTLDDDGIVRVTGRLKDIINRGGEKFATRDIEEVLALHPAVFEAAVVPAPHPRYGEQPAAFVHLRPGAGGVDGSELAAFLRSTGLATQKIPEVWRFVEELPRTSAGKVKKFVLTDQLAESQGGMMGDRGEIENLLYEYQARLDAGDLEGMAALFEHAVMSADTVGATWAGAEEVLGLYRQIFRIYEDGSPHTTHTTLNPIIHIDSQAGTATCRSVYVVYQQVGDFPLQPIITGGYHDTFERIDGSWRFASRKFVAGLQGDLRAHQILENHPVFDET